MRKLGEWLIFWQISFEECQCFRYFIFMGAKIIDLWHSFKFIIDFWDIICIVNMSQL